MGQPLGDLASFAIWQITRSPSTLETARLFLAIDDGY
jgi:hypothetical protein